MYRQEVENRYFEWMVTLVCENRFVGNNSYRKLLSYLHDTEFIYYLHRDGDRATDGMDLRYRFAYYNQDLQDAEKYLTGPCSVLEMMIALAIRCEEQIMVDPKIGDRTGQWFWKMVVSLGLGGMLDSRFDSAYVEKSVYKFLNREYETDGRGGLFTVRNSTRDMRDISIWDQLSYFLDSSFM